MVNLDSVVSYFVNGYSTKGPAIEHYDYYVDATKGKVILRLYVAGGVATGEEPR